MKFLSLLPALVLFTLDAAGAERAPNIVIIFADDLGYGDLGYTGNNMIKTPHIDALARNGVVLENYYAPSPVCSPSRASMLTGRLAPRNGLTAVPFPTGHAVDRLNRLFNNPVRLPREICEKLMEDAKMGGNARISVDLERQVVVRPNGEEIPFQIDPLRRHLMLNGLDDIGQTMQHAPAIDSFESRQRAAQPWLYA